jgi:hypothetical protein
LRRRAGLVFGGSLAWVALMLAVIVLVPPAVSAQQQPQGGGAPVVNQYATVAVHLDLSPTYDFVGSGVNHVTASIFVPTLDNNQNTSVEILTSFRASHFNESVMIKGANVSLSYRIIPGRFGIYIGYDSIIPANASSFSATISGTQGGSTFLWRYLATNPLVEFTGLNGGISYSQTMDVPPGSVLSQQYDSYGSALPLSFPTNRTSAGTTYLVNPATALLVMQPTAFVPASIAVTVVALGMVVLAGLNLFPRGRLILSGAVGLLRRVTPSSGAGRSSLQRLNLRAGLKGLFQPKKLLSLFLLCALLMVAIGAVAGQDPRLKAYVIADPASVGQIQSSLDGARGNVFAITPSQDYSDITTMASIGQINMLVVSNYPPLELPEVTKFLIPALATGDIPLVVIDHSADPGVVDQIEAVVAPENIVTVGSAANLNANETQTLSTYMSSVTRGNVAGLSISNSGYKTIEILEAVLSFVLILLGWAALGSLALDTTSLTDMSHLATVVATGVFVFTFSEVVYVVTSALFAVPISLHAVVSGAHDLTMVGLLGFGGGSTPRLAAGVIGVVIGTASSGVGPRVKLSDFALIAGIAMIILVSPFFLGQFAFQGILLFGSSSYAFGSAFASSLSFKGFLYGIGGVLGGSVSPTYVMSAGKILFFAGLVPFAYLKRMGRTSTAFAVLLCALLLGDGGVRVGELTPEKTVIAVIPGIVAGFVILVPLIGLALVEKYVRGRWK